MRLTRRKLLVAMAGLVTMAILFIGCASKDIDPREAANALANEFDEWLTFEDSTKTDGAPPSENPDNPTTQPRIVQLVAPFEVRELSQIDDTATQRAYGEQFDITLNIDGQYIDEIPRVVAHVRQANKDDVADSYYLINTTRISDSVTLRATINYFPDLAGNAFEVRFLALNAAGEAGNSIAWNVVTDAAPGDSTVVTQCACEDADERNVEFTTADSCDDSTFQDQFESGACDAWRFARAGMNTQVADPNETFPDGTYFSPLTQSRVQVNTTCELAIECVRSASSAGPFPDGYGDSSGPGTSDRGGADRLADQFARLITVTDNRRLPGPPPPEHAGTMYEDRYPQIDYIQYGPPVDWGDVEMFDFMVERTGQAEVCHAVVHIFQANADSVASFHSRVEVLDDGGAIMISAEYTGGSEIDRFRGNAFGFRIALLNDNMEAGNYRNYYVVVPPTQAYPGKVPQCDPSEGMAAIAGSCMDSYILDWFDPDKPTYLNPDQLWVTALGSANNSDPGALWGFKYPSGMQVRVGGSSPYSPPSDCIDPLVACPPHSHSPSTPASPCTFEFFCP